MTESYTYEDFAGSCDEKARYKLANWLAHGYVIESFESYILLDRKDQQLMLSPDGRIWKVQECV